LPILSEKVRHVGISERKAPFILRARFVVGLAFAAVLLAVVGEMLPLPPTTERIAIAVVFSLFFFQVILYSVSWWKGRGTPVRW
jgi:hypothetical protein